jgi:DNA sulfur modification protein DndB
MSATLENVHPRTDLSRTARQARKPHVEKSVTKDQLQAELNAGWTRANFGQRKIKLQRPKDGVTLFADRIWCLLYDLEFTHLSGDGGVQFAGLPFTERPSKATLLLAIDDDVALLIEVRPDRGAVTFSATDAETSILESVQPALERTIRDTFGPRALGYAVWLTTNDVAAISSSLVGKASPLATKVLGANELSYYEELAKQLGPAAKYQFLADLFEGRQIPNMRETLPAIYTQLGMHPCYIFATSPARLLKIAYVAHRSKGQTVAMDAYQRLMKKSRMTEISDYIKNENGYFPTNIVINFKTSEPLSFEPAAGRTDEGNNITRLGWLALPAYYKAAWVIDGQHRLYGYAYSGLDDAKDHEVTVLAFDNLPVSEQVKLFVEINGKQKRVRQNLLIELFADLHWGSKDPEDLRKAVIARALLALNADQSSPFYDRILKAEDRSDSRHSITLNTVFKELDHDVFFATPNGVEAGFFWRDQPDEMVHATCQGLNTWFGAIVRKAENNWNLGKAEGGALGTNDSVASLLMLLRSVLDWYREHRSSYAGVSCQEYVERFAKALAEHFETFSEEEWRTYRSGRGAQGQLDRMRQLQAYLHNRFDDFQPSGLAEFELQQKQNMTAEARKIIDDIETRLKRHVLTRLRDELGKDETQWWMGGVPKSVRKKIDDRRNEVGPKARQREDYFDLIDYRDIAVQNWSIFRDTLGDDQGRDKGTKWMVDVNDLRNRFSHASKEQAATAEDVRYLRKMLEALETRIKRAESDAE